MEDKPCGKGRFCDLHYGVCRTEKSPGFACRRDRMCGKGLACMFGRCQAKIATGEEGKTYITTTAHPNKIKNKEINPVLFVWALMCLCVSMSAGVERIKVKHVDNILFCDSMLLSEDVYTRGCNTIHTRHCFGPLTNPNATTRKEARLYYIVPHTIMFTLSGIHGMEWLP